MSFSEIMNAGSLLAVIVLMLDFRLNMRKENRVTISDALRLENRLTCLETKVDILIKKGGN
jgi:hypothetical protein